MRLVVALALAAAAPSPAAAVDPGCDAACLAQVERIADEAVSLAASVSDERERDVALQAVARNFSLYGFDRQAVAAAVAMRGGGRREALRDALAGGRAFLDYDPDRDDPCMRSGWILNGPGTARERTATLEERVRRCVLDRNAHWGPTLPRESLDAAYGRLPDGAIRAALLAYIALHFEDGRTLAWAAGEARRLEPLMEPEVWESFVGEMRQPYALYKRGQREEAIAAARASTDPYALVELIRLLIEDGAPAEAAALLDPMSRTQLPLPDGPCDDWFGYGGVFQRLTYSRVRQGGDPHLAAFLDLLARSPQYQARCPEGMPDEIALALLLRAGRIEEAIARAAATGDPLTYAKFLGTVGSVNLLNGRRDAAHPYLLRAFAAFPAGPVARPGEAAELRNWNLFAYAATTLIEDLSSLGEIERASDLASRFPNRGWRAVALSYLAAGARGVRGYESDRNPLFPSEGLGWGPEPASQMPGR